MTGRHAGQNTGSTDYAYTGRHEAPAPEGCRVTVTVADPNGEGGGLLVCNREEHDDPQHYDASDDVLWQLPTYPAPELAGAVA